MKATSVAPTLCSALMLMMPPAVQAFAYMGQGEHPLPLQPEDTGLAAVTWPDNGTEVPLALDIEPAPYVDSVFAAMEEWNAVDTRLRFVQDAGNAGQPCETRDRINTVGWTSSTCSGDAYGDALALTVVSFRFNNQRQRREISDTDVLVDENRSWVPRASGSSRPGTVDFYRVVLHELGHVLGLEHPDEAGQTVEAIMNSRVSETAALQDDDIRGIVFLYGGAPGTGVAANGTRTESGGGGGADLVLPLTAGLGAAARLISRDKTIRRSRLRRKRVARFRGAGL